MAFDVELEQILEFVLMLIVGVELEQIVELHCFNVNHKFHNSRIKKYFKKYFDKNSKVITIRILVIK